MEIFDRPEFDGHELIVFGHDAATSLRAIIAIHSTALGPAAGGCRRWPYASTAEAVADVLRLSRGMSYKNALAGVPFGGGKAVIIGEARKAKTPELFEAFGRFVDSLGGRYVTAEDVGTTTADMASVARVTRHAAGLGRAPGEAGGDPGPKTALGVCLGIKAAVRFRLGRQGLKDLPVAVQGGGGVGYHRWGLLAAEGAQLRVADVRPAVVQRVCEEFRARAVPVEDLLAEDRDGLAPCAPGAAPAQTGGLRARGHPAPPALAESSASASGAGAAVKYTVAHEAGHRHREPEGRRRQDHHGGQSRGIPAQQPSPPRRDACC